MPASNLKTMPIAAVRALAGEPASDLAVFLPGPDGKEPVLYRQSGVGLVSPDFERLSERGVSHFLVCGDGLTDCERILEDHLSDLLRDPKIDAKQKADCVYHVGLSVVQELLGGADASPHTDRASRLLDTVIDGILADSAVGANLLRMSAHHQTTASHMFAVSVLAILLGTEVLDGNRSMVKELGLAGMLHDLGKIKLQPGMLNKSTPLTPEEIQLIQHHPIESVRLVDDDPVAGKAVRQMIMQHHERIDGRGYPLGLSGSELLTGSKILSIVDTFHAMIGRRQYRARIGPTQAVRVLKHQVGRQFDADLYAEWESLFYRVWDDRCCASETDHETSDPHGDTTTRKDRVSQRRDEVARGRTRLACDGKVRIQCIYVGRLEDVSAASDEFTAPLHDLSTTGVCLMSAHPMFRGEVVNVLIELETTQLWLRGLVRWCRKQGPDGNYKTGVQFLQRISPHRAREKAEVKGMDDPLLFPACALDVA